MLSKTLGQTNETIDTNINYGISFFEFDLDNNGIKEQYLLGTRNCSQEVVLLRINDAN
jgi:hypothetical protein